MPSQPRKGAFRIIEGDGVQPFLERLPEKTGGGLVNRPFQDDAPAPPPPPPAPPAAPAAAGEGDVAMQE